MTDIHHDKLLILDFGSQYTQLIARRIREIGVYCEIWAWDHDPAAIRAWAPRGIILSGGPGSVTAADSPRVPQLVFDLGIPLLGICYGMQAMAVQLGGEVEAGHKREFGHASVTLSSACQLLDPPPPSQSSPSGEGESWMGVAQQPHLQSLPATDARTLEVWMSHGDRVTRLPTGFVGVAQTDSVPLVAMADVARHWYGLQFHPEVTHTRDGMAILRRFVLDICACKALWTARHIIADLSQRISEKVGRDKVLLGLSGGVDSSVVAALLEHAIGEQLVCVFVDNGLLRQGESEQVMETMARHLGVRVIRVAAAQRFYAALRGVVDPEQKRKIIGRIFVEVFEEQSRQLEGVRWLAQGTIYPDVIESAGAKTGKAQVIKSHHNVGGLPERMQLQLLEPLRELFKDEVRRIGETLRLPHEMVYRHPFPGPGLGVRILGEVKPEYAELLRHADAIYIEELRTHDLYDKVSQAFAVFLPVRSVGVMGDERAYEWVVALRAVETVDFMTARSSHLPYPFLDQVAARIINEIPGISRVVYDISSKPPATIEWE